jgi:hypothetical protein
MQVHLFDNLYLWKRKHATNTIFFINMITLWGRHSIFVLSVRQSQKSFRSNSSYILNENSSKFCMLG